MQQKENDGGVKEKRISAWMKVSMRRYTGDCSRTCDCPRGRTPRRHASARRPKSETLLLLRMRAAPSRGEKKKLETRISRRASDSARSYSTPPFQSLLRAQRRVRATLRSLLALSPTPTASVAGLPKYIAGASGGSASRFHESAPLHIHIEAQPAPTIRSSPDSAPAVPLFLRSETVSTKMLHAGSLHAMRTQQLRANACSPQPLLRKREPRTQLRCFDTCPAIFNLKWICF